MISLSINYREEVRNYTGRIQSKKQTRLQIVTSVLSLLSVDYMQSSKINIKNMPDLSKLNDDKSL